MDVFQHWAWFRREGGHWLGEWAGMVPGPVLPDEMIGMARDRAMNRWLQVMQSAVSPTQSAWPTIDQAWDCAAWAACPPGGAVCLDVSASGWPVGDYCWHRWGEAAHRLEEPSERYWVELDCDRQRLVANLQAHRPLRAPARRRVLDITGTPLEAWHGHLFGTLPDMARLFPRQKVKELYGIS